MTIIPPIKTQGIKTKLIPFIREKIEDIDRNATTWIEPFFGSGVVGFNAGFKNNIVGDFNKDIIDFYEGIRTGNINHELISCHLNRCHIEMMESEDDGWEYYRKVRDRFNENPNSLDFIFLSRACFNGIMRYSKQGKFNTPFCKNKNKFHSSHVDKISSQILDVQEVICKNNWIFNHSHFRDTIAMGNSDSLIYCDPPYFGRNNDYLGGWNEDLELELFEMLSKSDGKFMLSTWISDSEKNNPMIEKYWGKYNISIKEHKYIVGGESKRRNSVMEGLITNF